MIFVNIICNDVIPILRPAFKQLLSLYECRHFYNTKLVCFTSRNWKHICKYVCMNPVNYDVSESLQFNRKSCLSLGFSSTNVSMLLLFNTAGRPDPCWSLSRWRPSGYTISLYNVLSRRAHGKITEVLVFLCRFVWLLRLTHAIIFAKAGNDEPL